MPVCVGEACLYNRLLGRCCLVFLWCERAFMRILVFGAAGMLGHALVRELKQAHEVYAAVRSEPPEELEGASATFIGTDVADADAIELLLEASRPQWVINAAGVVKQKSDGAATQIAVNALAPHRMAELCHAQGVPILHFSTDCVFSGARGQYSEEDVPDPVDLYGLSKLLGEITENGALTLRTSMIGLELQTHHGLVEWFLRQQGRANGYRHAVFSGLTTQELARVARSIVERRSPLTGLLHVAAVPINKYDLLRQLSERLPWHSVELEPVDQPVIDRTLVSRAFTALTGYVAPSWPVMLDELARAIDERRSSRR